MNWFYPPHVGPWNQALPARAAFSFFPYRASAGLNNARLLLNKENGSICILAHPYHVIERNTRNYPSHCAPYLEV